MRKKRSTYALPLIALRQAARALLQATLVAATLLGAGAHYCSPGEATVCDAVLVVCTYPSNWCSDVQSTLRGTGAFVTVDTFDATFATPTAELLNPYHAALVYSGGSPFSDAALLGDRLADYHDQGSGVVITSLSNVNGYGVNLQGAYSAPENGYALLDYASGDYDNRSDILGDVLESQSPLMTGVASLAAAFSFRSTASVINGHGVVVARWRGGGQEPLVVRGTRCGRTLVELNFFPPSGSEQSNFWSGDGAALLRNALKYSRCMPRGPGTASTAGAAHVPRGGG
jgi:hypothetical protein